MNLELAGGKEHIYTLHDASHVLRRGRLRRNPALDHARARERCGRSRGSSCVARVGARRVRLAGADAVPGAALRPRRRAPGHRANGDLRGSNGCFRGVGGRPRPRSVFLRGVPVPGAASVLRHDYPSRPASCARSATRGPTWSSSPAGARFAAQARSRGAALERVPYVLLVESHDAGPRAGLAPRRSRRRWCRRSCAAPRGARVGSLARDSVLARGADAGAGRRVRKHDRRRAFGERSRAARGAAGSSFARRWGFGRTRTWSCSRGAARAEKGLDTLVRARRPRPTRLVLVLVGRRAGARAARELRLARRRGRVRRHVPWSARRGVRRRATSSRCSRPRAVGRRRERGGRCGLPLVLSDRVGAAADLLARRRERDARPGRRRRGRGGDALRRLAADPRAPPALRRPLARARRAAGATSRRSRTLVDGVREATAAR